MKISVIGGSQGTGALAVTAALARGHEVTAFARSPQKLELEHPKLSPPPVRGFRLPSRASRLPSRASRLPSADSASRPSIVVDPDAHGVCSPHDADGLPSLDLHH